MFLLSFLILYMNEDCFAGDKITPTGSRQAGMGRVSVAITDFWNSQNNQAGIALMDKISAGIYYESRFTINQLSSKSAAVVVPTGIGVVGATFNYFGYSLYNEMKIGLVYARSFGQYFRMGVQLDYLQTSLGNDYGHKGNITFEIGVQSDVTENLTLGAWAFNPIQVKLADYDDERIPAVFRFGIAWHFSDHFFATVEAEKNTAFRPIIVRGGLEYGIKERFFLRTGFSSGEEIFSMGFGFQIKILRFDISAVMHQSLGFSPQASMIFRF
jgi:hypothetical protein